MPFINYIAPEPSTVKFNRLVMGMLMVATVFSERIELFYLFFIINFISLVTTLHYSPTTLVYKMISKVIGHELCRISKTYERSYAMSKETERFEMTLRVLFSGVALLLFSSFPMVTWFIAIFMAIFMAISTFFGFCLASLGFIGLRNMKAYYFGTR